MNFTQTLDLEFIREYVTEESICNKLINYLEHNEIIDEAIFSLLGEKCNRIAHFLTFPINKETFVKRIPFYCYEPNRESDQVMSLRQYLMDTSNCYEEDEIDVTVEKLFLALEKLFYVHKIDIATIYDYPFQHATMNRTETLFYWQHYLDLASNFNIQDKTPKHLITEYNYMLEKAGLKPIIYEIREYGYFNPNFIGREGNILKADGIFPCDKDGQPILRWIGLEIKNAKKIWVKVDEKLKGTLYIETTPFTSVWGLNCWGRNDDGSDAWYQLYIGAQLMEFDYKKLKKFRKDEKLTQQQVADAIGATLRTYQKWESGSTCPDCRYLLRLMNVLDIQSVQDLTLLTD